MWTKPTTYIFDEDADELLATAIGLRDMNLEPEEVREW